MSSGHKRKEDYSILFILSGKLGQDADEHSNYRIATQKKPHIPRCKTRNHSANTSYVAKDEEDEHINL